jgi:hypothetical protein
MMGGGFRRLTKHFPLRQRPDDEASRFVQSSEGKTRSPAYALVDQHGRTPACLANRQGAATAGRYQRGLGRCQRQIKITLGEQSVHPQWAGQSHWNFYGADEILYITVISLHLSHGFWIRNPGPRLRGHPQQAPALVQRFRRKASASRNMRGGRCFRPAQSGRQCVHVGLFQFMMAEKIVSFA